MTMTMGRLDDHLAAMAAMREAAEEREARRMVEAEARYLWQHGSLVDLIGADSAVITAIMDRARREDDRMA